MKQAKVIKVRPGCKYMVGDYLERERTGNGWMYTFGGGVWTIVEIKEKRSEFIEIVEEVKRFGDLGIRDSYMYDYVGDLVECRDRNLLCSGRPTPELAAAAYAMQKLSHLMYDVRDGREPDWSGVEYIYIVMISFGCIATATTKSEVSFLAFPTAEMRDSFLNNHVDLIETALPLL